jgi:hypothetical protein
MAREALQLPPTSQDLRGAETRPYFLWWTELTVRDFEQLLGDPSPERRAYWLGALLREANTRDVWLFTTPEQIRLLCPQLVRHLGPSRARWAWLLDIEDAGCTPPEASA